jgi:hypothetical protein
MKRLILLTMILTPGAIHAIRQMTDPVERNPLPQWGLVAARAADQTPGDSDRRTITSSLMATRDRAKRDAQVKLDREIAEWLVQSGIPWSWKPPARLVKKVIARHETHTIKRPYGTMYEEELSADFSAPMKGRFLQAYQREVTAHRLGMAGLGLCFVLACLAAVSGYIRADEATKGYYTNTLRLASAAAVGAAGYVVYRALT